MAQSVREARELEKAVVDKIRKDGTFDSFRRRITEEELRAIMADAVGQSRTLASQDARYGKLNEKELVDRLREEMEEVVMSARAHVYAKQVWDALTDESKGVGREIYEAVYEVRERLEAADAGGAGAGAGGIKKEEKVYEGGLSHRHSD